MGAVVLEGGGGGAILKQAIVLGESKFFNASVIKLRHRFDTTRSSKSALNFFKFYHFGHFDVLSAFRV